MVDLFSPLTPEARRDNRAAYQSFLADRDGVVDVERRTLTRREEGMARYTKPLSRLREIDRPLFEAQYASFDPKVAMPPEMMLLMALVKVNAAESFGANRTYDRLFRQAIKNGDAVELTLVIEETYHTRILLSAAVLYGIEVTAPFKPPPTLRALISGITVSPEFISRPLTLASELLGTLVFTNLLYKTRDILRHDPELRDSVEERLCDVLVDELGHVSFNRMCLGGAGLAQARMILRILGMTLGGVIPELSVLGAMSDLSEKDLDSLFNGTRLPEHVRKAAFLS
jgi:hypothetical protein